MIAAGGAPNGASTSTSSPGSLRTFTWLRAFVTAGTTIAAFGWQRAVCSEVRRPTVGHEGVVVAERDVSTARDFETLVHASREPEVRVVEHDLIGGHARVVGGFPRRSVVDDHELVGHVGVAAAPSRRTAACTAGCPTRARRPTAPVRSGAAGRVGGGDGRRVGRQPVEHSLELVGAALPVEVALDDVEAVGDEPLRQLGRRRGGGEPRRPSRVRRAAARRARSPRGPRTRGIRRCRWSRAGCRTRGIRDRVGRSPRTSSPPRTRAPPRTRGRGRAARGSCPSSAPPGCRGAHPLRGSCRCPSTPVAARRCRAAGTASCPGYGWNISRFTPPSCTVGR